MRDWASDHALFSVLEKWIESAIRPASTSAAAIILLLRPSFQFLTTQDLGRSSPYRCSSAHKILLQLQLAYQRGRNNDAHHVIHTVLKIHWTVITIHRPPFRLIPELLVDSLPPGDCSTASPYFNCFKNDSSRRTHADVEVLISSVHSMPIVHNKERG